MKRTEIHYQVFYTEERIDLGSKKEFLTVRTPMIKIIDIRNTASLKDIRNEFGEEVERRYKKSRDCYHLSFNYPGSVVLYYKELIPHTKLYAGLMLTPETFGLIIRYMKRAGKALLNIRREIAREMEKNRREEEAKEAKRKFFKDLYSNHPDPEFTRFAKAAFENHEETKASKIKRIKI